LTKEWEEKKKSNGKRGLGERKARGEKKRASERARVEARVTSKQGLGRSRSPFERGGGSKRLLARDRTASEGRRESGEERERQFEQER